MSQCKECGIKLTKRNWFPSFRKLNYHKCKPCHYQANEQWIAKNKERRHEINRNTYYKHHDAELIYEAKRRKLYPDYQKQWSQSPSGKHHKALRDAKRRKLLGEPKTILGRWFPGAELHHITAETVVYIPKALHQSIRHSLTRNRNMDEINVAAMEFYERGGPR